MSDTVQIPASEWNKLKRTLAIIEQRLITEEMISEEEAAKLLSIKVSTLKNRVWDGTIKKDMYTESPTGKKFFNKRKLIGIQ